MPGRVRFHILRNRCSAANRASRAVRVALPRLDDAPSPPGRGMPGFASDADVTAHGKPLKLLRFGNAVKKYLFNQSDKRKMRIRPQAGVSSQLFQAGCKTPPCPRLQSTPKRVGLGGRTPGESPRNGHHAKPVTCLLACFRRMRVSACGMSAAGVTGEFGAAPCEVAVRGDVHAWGA